MGCSMPLSEFQLPVCTKPVEDDLGEQHIQDEHGNTAVGDVRLFLFLVGLATPAIIKIFATSNIAWVQVFAGMYVVWYAVTESLEYVNRALDHR
jgi:hypothetical protein